MRAACRFCYSAAKMLWKGQVSAGLLPNLALLAESVPPEFSEVWDKESEAGGV